MSSNARATGTSMRSVPADGVKPGDIMIRNAAEREDEWQLQRPEAAPLDASVNLPNSVVIPMEVVAESAQLQSNLTRALHKVSAPSSARSVGPRRVYCGEWTSLHPAWRRQLGSSGGLPEPATVAQTDNYVQHAKSKSQLSARTISRYRVRGNCPQVAPESIEQIHSRDAATSSWSHRCMLRATGSNEVFSVVSSLERGQYDRGGDDVADPSGTQPDPSQAPPPPFQFGIRAFTDRSGRGQQQVVGPVVRREASPLDRATPRSRHRRTPLSAHVGTPRRPLCTVRQGNGYERRRGRVWSRVRPRSTTPGTRPDRQRSARCRPAGDVYRNTTGHTRSRGHVHRPDRSESTCRPGSRATTAGVGLGRGLGAVRGVIGDHIDRFVQVPVRGGDRHPGLGGLQPQRRVVPKPAQDQDRLGARHARTTSVRGADRSSMSVEQAGDMPQGFRRDVADGRVGEHVGPLVSKNWFLGRNRSSSTGPASYPRDTPQPHRSRESHKPQ